jgi:hypothetical protein
LAKTLPVTAAVSNSSTTAGNSTATSSNNGGSDLSGGAIAGIVVGIVSAIAAAITAWIQWRAYKKKKIMRGEGQESALQVIHRGQQPHSVGIPSHVFSGDAGARATYLRETKSISTFGKLIAIITTSERWEIVRGGRIIRGTVVGGEIREEVVD